MYNNPYLSSYSPQPSIDRINAQINELQKMKENMQQPVQPAPTNLTQNFQLAPTNRDVIKYAASLEEVQRDMVIGDTPYFSKDMSVVWIKNTKGEIKTFELNEIIPKDDKDIKIEMLMAEIEKLKKDVINNERIYTNDDSTENESNTESYDEPIRTTTKASKSSSVPRISANAKK